MKDVRDQVAVITGAASGIGRALAERFVTAGMKVVLSDIELEPLVLAERSLRERGAQVHAVRTDVSHPQQVRELAAETLKRFGAVHVLCNNAGIFEGGGSPSWTTSLDEWHWTLNVNLMGVVHGIQAFMPALLEHGGEGHVVNVASIGGWISGNALYSVSKFGVVALSESLYVELRRSNAKIGVSVLCPGYVKTRLADAERNRPADCEPSAPSPGRATLRKYFAQAIDGGIDASIVAEHTLRAILEDRFYVFTHDDSVPTIEQKFDTLRAGLNPLVPVLRSANK